MLSAACAIREDLGFARAPILEARYTSDVEAIRAAIPEDEFDAAWADGSKLTLAEAVRYATRRRGTRGPQGVGWESLTRTEGDVVGLVAEGLRNREVAERLFVSRATVQNHLRHVFAKLGLTSRVELALEATRREQEANTPENE